MILIFMGVSACGKTTIGQRLAAELDWHFYDADDFHSADNRAKMAAGQQLSDEDRYPWLNAINRRIKEIISEGNSSAIFTCSALKRIYRDRLREGVDATNFHIVYLKVDEETAAQRIVKRKGHFFNPVLLKNQFEILEVPNENDERDAVIVDASKSMDDVIADVKNILKLPHEKN